MQRHARELVPRRRELREHPLREVKARRGRGDRAGAIGVDGLVALAILRVRRAADVGRQRHLARGGERGVDGAVGRRDELDLDGRAVAREHGRIELGARATDAQSPADAQARRRAPERGPALSRARLAEALHEQQLDGATGRLVPVQPRRDDARVVDHDERAHGRARRELSHLRVRDGPARAIDDQHPRAVALRRGLLRDQLLGQRVVELRQAHAHRQAWTRPRREVT